MSDQAGYCPHGVYVGGVGPDWMCGECEDGGRTMTAIHTTALTYDRDLSMWGAVCTDCDWQSAYLSDDRTEARREAVEHERDVERASRRSLASAQTQLESRVGGRK